MGTLPCRDGGICGRYSFPGTHPPGGGACPGRLCDSVDGEVRAHQSRPSEARPRRLRVGVVVTGLAGFAYVVCTRVAAR